jgi:5'(3')-deoxyribonucleotidase
VEVIRLPGVTLDLDNVLKDLVGSVIWFAQNDFGVTLRREVDFDTWDKSIGHKLGFDNHEDYLTWAWKNPDIHREAMPVEGAVETVRQIYLGYTCITILTASYFPDLVADWLDKHGFPYDKIIFDSDKSKYDFDVLVDDSPSTLKKLSDMGKPVVRFRWPWNSKPELDHLPTIDGWGASSIAKIVEAAR